MDELNYVIRILTYCVISTLYVTHLLNLRCASYKEVRCMYFDTANLWIYRPLHPNVDFICIWAVHIGMERSVLQKKSYQKLLWLQMVKAKAQILMMKSRHVVYNLLRKSFLSLKDCLTLMSPAKKRHEANVFYDYTQHF